MSDIDLPKTDAGSRVELRVLFAYVWDGRKIILWTMLAFLILGFAWYRTTPRVYVVTAVLSSAPGSSTNSSTGGALSGAARLIGLGGPANGPQAEYTKFQALLTSSALAERLAAQPDFLPLMFPGQWDESTHSWRERTGFMSDARGAIRDMLGSPPPHAPNADSILGFLNGGLDQSLSLQTALLELSVRSTNPQFAKLFLIRAHRAADDILRDAARARSQRRIDYLQRTLRSVGAVEQREALIQLLTQEEQTNMMIESDPNFAADVVDPPHISPNPVSPLFSIAMVVSLFGGFVFGLVIYAILRAFELHRTTIQWGPKRWAEALPFRRR